MAIAVVLLSGGLDSYTTAALARRDGFAVHALTFRYGQRHGQEVEAAANVARVLGVARHSETLEELVVYRQEYGERGLWVRPLAMFVEEVEVGGRRVPRFAFVGEA